MSGRTKLRVVDLWLHHECPSIPDDRWVYRSDLRLNDDFGWKVISKGYLPSDGGYRFLDSVTFCPYCGYRLPASVAMGTCASTPCTNPVASFRTQAIYCSATCRYREQKRSRRAKGMS